jgi:hypothetical protein
VRRYAKFLLLRKHHLELQHPIPPIDVALVWTAHMSVSGEYARDMLQLLQRPFTDMPGERCDGGAGSNAIRKLVDVTIKI